MGIAPVRRGRSNHAAAQSRLAEHGARRCEQQAGCVGAPGRALAEMCKGGSACGSHRTAKCNAKGWERVTARNNISNCTGKCTMGSLARAGSEARPGSERRRPATGRRPVPSTGQNTFLPAHCGLRPPFTAEERIRSESESRVSPALAGAADRSCTSGWSLKCCDRITSDSSGS